MNKLPLARTTDVVVQNLGKEILIYDLNTHKAFNLNETSSIVYQACNDKTSFSELISKTNFPEEIIFMALDELREQKLVEDDKSYVSPFNDMSRREVIRKVGLGTMIALPLVSGLIAPTAAMAQSVCGAACNCPNNVAIGGTCGAGVGAITCAAGCTCTRQPNAGGGFTDTCA